MKGSGKPKARNWQEYNESLVKRGEMYLIFSFLDSWEKDLENLNRGKLGRRFAYPWAFIELLMMIHIIFHLPYRQLEGFLRKLSELIPMKSNPRTIPIFRDVVPNSSSTFPKQYRLAVILL